jgi:hypothetical protein
MFTMRLGDGYRMFWSTITPTECGRLQTLSVPEFCHGVDFPGTCGEGTRGIWDLWPIINPLRPHPLEDADRLCRPIRVPEQTPQIALISFLHKDERSAEALWLEVFLASEPGEGGRSPLGDWTERLQATKNDPSQEAVVRLNLGDVAPDEIACFKSQKKLFTTDISLEIRPRSA